MNFKVYLSHFADIGCTKFPKTCCGKSLTPLADNVLHFYMLGATKALVNTVRIYEVMAFGAGISGWCPLSFIHLQILHRLQVGVLCERDYTIIFIKGHRTN